MGGILTKKAKYKIILQVIAVLIIIVCWWFLPYKCLNETSIDEILYIEIAYGANGSVKRIENREQINYIVEPIKASRLQKEKLSLGYVGIDIWIAFYNKEKEKIEEFCINNGTVIRKDPYFYVDTSGKMKKCYDYLMSIKEQ